jgi:restriction system protein
MARRRGFFAEMAHQAQVAEKRRQQAQRAAEREQAAAARKAEQARKASERAKAQAVRANAAARKAADQEAKRLHAESMQAHVDELNASLRATYEDIDTLLSWTLGFDDFVDLETLRVHPEHPPFSRPDLEQPAPAPPLPQPPPEPQYVEPQPESKGLSGMFGGKKRHAEQVAAAQAEYQRAHQQWQTSVSQIPAIRERQLAEYAQVEQRRLAALAEARSLYEEECRQREAAASASNAELDQLIHGLELNVDSAVQEYVSIVLENSVYPEAFEVEHDFAFDAELRELTLHVTVPPPETVPVVKEYKYVKSKDEVTSSELSQKDRKTRYSGAVEQVAIRSLHEVFEADRAGKIQTMALTVGANAIDPATGNSVRTTFVAVAADRDRFMSFDLANVVPSETLKLLNAQVSKNPYGLVGIDQSQGVRG